MEPEALRPGPPDKSAKVAAARSFAPLSAIPLTVLGLLGSDSPVPLPLFLSRVPAGFPTPADDYVEAVVEDPLRVWDHAVDKEIWPPS